VSLTGATVVGGGGVVGATGGATVGKVGGSVLSITPHSCNVVHILRNNQILISKG
jgi:hypothetical protein